MQHHGAPTRLLDWTYSIYVALYFAAEYAYFDRTPSGAAVWMLNATWATEASAKLFAVVGCDGYIRNRLPHYQDEQMFAEAFSLVDPTRAPDHPAKPIPCICPVSPFQLNERLTIQKGVFTCAGDVTRSFEENLHALEGYKQKENLVRFLLPRQTLDKILDELFYMNITRATLFPGLDGFAQSLRTNLASLSPGSARPD
jgi:hypothetical protein